MSAHLFTIPPQIAFAANEMRVTLESDNIAPDRAYITLELTNVDGPPNGNTFIISFSGKTWTFSFLDVIDNSGWLLPTKTAAQTAPQYWAYIAERLRIVQAITDEFDVIEEYPLLKLIYKTITHLSITVVSTITVNVTAHSVTSIVNVQNLAASISVHDAATHEELTQRIGAYNIATKQCSFDIHSIFEDLAPTLPDPSVTSIQTASTAFKRYYIRYADRYGIPPQSEIRHKSQNLIAIAGGTASGNRNLFFQPTAPLLALHNFKTQTNDLFVKQITQVQPDWLYFVAQNDEPNLTWTVLLRYGAGYRDTFTTNAQFSCIAGEVQCLPIGFRQLGLQNYIIPNAFSTSSIIGYDISIRRPNDDILLTASYDLELSRHPWNLYIVFENGLGGIESVRAKGKKQLKYDSDIINVEKSNGDLSVAFSTGVSSYDVSLGWYDYYYLDALRQLLLAKAWLFDPKTNTYTEIVPEKQSFEFIPDDNDLHTLNFKFRTAKTDSQANNY
jgi:hypothetical protein